jgi:hypothetical protein
MMEGIEVLATGIMGIGSTVNWGLIVIIGLIAGGIVGITVGFGSLSIFGGLGAGILAFLAAASLTAMATEKPAYTIPIYKVVIKDSISMNEFSERYEIIDQEGKIYTIKEREGAINSNSSSS